MTKGERRASGLDPLDHADSTGPVTPKSGRSHGHSRRESLRNSVCLLGCGLDETRHRPPGPHRPRKVCFRDLMDSWILRISQTTPESRNKSRAPRSVHGLHSISALFGRVGTVPSKTVLGLSPRVHIPPNTCSKQLTEHSSSTCPGRGETSPNLCSAVFAHTRIVQCATFRISCPR